MNFILEKGRLRKGARFAGKGGVLKTKESFSGCVWGCGVGQTRGAHSLSELTNCKSKKN